MKDYQEMYDMKKYGQKELQIISEFARKSMKEPSLCEDMNEEDRWFLIYATYAYDLYYPTRSGMIKNVKKSKAAEKEEPGFVDQIILNATYLVMLEFNSSALRVVNRSLLKKKIAGALFFEYLNRFKEIGALVKAHTAENKLEIVYRMSDPKGVYSVNVMRIANSIVNDALVIRPGGEIIFFDPEKINQAINKERDNPKLVSNDVS